MNKTFGTKKGILLGLVIWGALILAFYDVGLPGIINLQPVPMIMHPLILLFAGTIWFGIRYQVAGEQLLIKLGPFTPWKVNIIDIQSVSRSYNPLSSPAPSLRRIKLKIRDGGFLLLTPSDERQFIKTLNSINPQIQNKVRDESPGRMERFLYWLL